MHENKGLAKDSSLLHLAAQIATKDQFQHIVDTYPVDVNVVDEDGNTPLHLAAFYGRQDIAHILLQRPDINDTIVNGRGKQPVELAQFPALAEVMQYARAQYVGTTAVKMKEYLQKEDTDKLEELLSQPRAAALLDINGQDPDTGSTVLHDFVRKRNKKMVEFILGHGGDPFRRDKKGVLPIDLAKDEGIRKLLKDSRKQQPVIGGQQSGGAPGPLGSAPSIKGYLKKWTNFTGGYKLRWFVLENGTLSYYKRQEDTERACRGAINLRGATLHLDSSEKNRFEVYVKGGVKFHLKANHPVETNRWVWALQNAIQYAKDQEKQAGASQASLAAASATLVAGDGSGGLPPPARSDTSTSAGARLSSSSATSARLVRPTHKRSNSGSTDASNVVVDGDRRSVAGDRNNFIDNDLGRLDNNLSLDDYEDEDEDDDYDEDEDRKPEQLALLEETITVEVDAVRKVAKSAADNIGNSSPEELSNSLEMVSRSAADIATGFQQYLQLVSQRESKYKRKLVRSEQKQRLWVENLRQLQVEHDKIQGALFEARMRRRKSRVPHDEGATVAGAAVAGGAAAAAAGAGAGATGAVGTKSGDSLAPPPQIQHAGSSDESALTDEEEEDEFFDVDENLEGAEVTASKEEGPSDSESLTEEQKAVKARIEEEGSFLGYEDPPRDKLAMDEDDRPKISLWGILKNLIGKDMTRMTLPVSFNECTNLLQRSAEDMEYIETLENAAATVDDPGLRIAYVAAFAASSYSSTINRIAKPFNPILGETFEYSRPDKGYRLFAEQVSHHPPIGAMIAESPKWDFYGESNVKSKFNGRSFDINPLGRWYVVLRPNKGAEVNEELYSFRKLTSSVVGIITGSPVVDNYGDMEIVNHTLGFKALVNFKSRGWRGNGAYELKGKCVSPSGKHLWTVVGKWNDKIVAINEDNHEDKRLLWKVHDRPKRPFNLTLFAISLNALPERLRPWIAPTDTRLRPDQRAMEEGRYDDASDEKQRVESKQRAARREREAKEIEYKPYWFTKTTHPVTGDVWYRPHGDYWQRRANKDLANTGDIF